MKLAATPAPTTIRAAANDPQQPVFEMRYDIAAEHAAHQPEPEHHQPQCRYAYARYRELVCQPG